MGFARGEEKIFKGEFSNSLPGEGCGCPCAKAGRGLADMQSGNAMWLPLPPPSPGKESHKPPALLMPEKQVIPFYYSINLLF
ncbi:hypothetical protein BC343_17730 [Mucilaginibacter pedocola]|uniref:Uncharacterized protein n=1 Tax=Mucilaginibacter pedocola TaxID=1792845 RepID=A0A1S9P789_9SPHI|nr:hypothetical protein BC343_17730 [Mucilaginibacter pedocola]